MRIAITSRWPFIVRVKATDLPKRINQLGSPSYAIYQRLTDISLERWMRLIVDGDIRAIIRDGEPPEHELRIVEGNLRIAYADAMGDNEYKFYCASIKEVTRLEITLAQIEQLITVLREAYVRAFADKLNQLVGSSFVFDVTRPEEYDKTLDRCFRRSRGIKISLDLERAKLLKYEEKHSGSTVTPKREYYYSVLLTISQTQGFRISSEISVWEFCELLRRHNKLIESQQIPVHGRRTH